MAESSLLDDALLLRERLEDALGAFRASVDRRGTLQFDRASISALSQAEDECQKVHAFVQECCNRLTLSIAVEGADGTELSFVVCPAALAVGELKQQIRGELPEAQEVEHIALLATSNGAVMQDTYLLMEYDVSAGVQMVFQEIPCELHVVWDATRAHWYDKQEKYDILAVESPRASADGALLFRPHTLDQLLLCPQGTGPFRTASEMPDGIDVRATGWSCSFLTQAPRPEDNGNYYCRTLLCAKPDIAHILMNHLRIGTYCDQHGHREVDFDMSSLSTGWHSVVVVAKPAENTQTFYVDGRAVGQLPDPVLEPIFKIGNSTDGEQSWACHVRDMRLFLRPFSEEELYRCVPCLPTDLLAGDRECSNPAATLD